MPVRDLRLVVAVAMTGCFAAAAGPEEFSADYNPPIPDWLAQAETFNGWYGKWDEEYCVENLPKFPCIIGGPWEGCDLERCHALGFRVIPYLDFVQLPWPEMGGQKQYSMTLEGHPEWVCVDEKGDYRPTFYAPNKGWYQTCFDSPGFLDQALAVVRRTMEGGCDGIFFDDCAMPKPCHGPQFGKHEHAHPDWDNMTAQRHFLMKAREVIKSFGDDKVSIINTWRPARTFADVCDAQMWEAFILGHSLRRREYSSGDMLYILHTRHDRTAPDRPIMALAYAGASNEEVKEDAYFSHAWARILGWPWADWFTLRGKPGEELYDVRLGPFVTDAVEVPNVVYRVCRDGLVVAVTSSDPQTVEVRVPAECRFDRLRDLFTGADHRPRDGVLQIELPGNSGRVLVSAPDVGQ